VHSQYGSAVLALFLLTGSYRGTPTQNDALYRRQQRPKSNTCRVSQREYL